MTAATTDPRRLARTAGLSELRLPELEDVDRRRSQLWLLSLLVALSIPAVIITMGLDIIPVGWVEMLDLRTVRLVLLALLVTTFGYVAEREVTLRRLTGLLIEERILTTSLTSRVEELDLMLQATRVMNSSLDLEQVLSQIASSARRLLRASGAAILLVAPDDPEMLEVAVTVGDAGLKAGARQPLGDGLAGDAAMRRDALIARPRGSARRGGRTVGEALAAPMAVRGTLVGVLEVAAGDQRAEFTDLDLRSISVFADAATAAITNARAYQRSQEQVADLLESDRAKDEFLTLVTHELRTPLTSVIGLLTTIGRRAGELSPAQVSQYAEVGRVQGWRLDRLIDNLLQTSRAQRGALQIHPSPVDVVQVIRRCVLAFEQVDGDRPLRLDAPESLIACVDGDALARILENLIGNAIKYTPRGSPIEVSLADEAGFVVARVRDHGPGIPYALRSEVFEKFGRAGDPHHAGGLGLGLYVVRALAEVHGGRVLLDEPPGGGACFTVVLATADLPDGDGADEDDPQELCA